MKAPAPGDQDTLRIAVIAGESSGDNLGARLLSSLREAAGCPLVFAGVGGPAMEREGMKSLFPLSEVALMSPLAILARLPRLIRLVRDTVEAVIAFRPDMLVIVDSPEFTHAVARRVRRRLPDLPVVDYVSPTVWAWRPWRARSMRRYVDHVAAIFPFEPEVHRRLGGPPCTYVGHPVVERMQELPPAVPMGSGDRPMVLVLPGSRVTEIRRLMPVFGRTLDRLAGEGREFEAVLPAVPHLVEEITDAVSSWRHRPRIVTGDAEKWATFKSSRLALAASGTVTLELALSGVPMVVAYRLDPLSAGLKWIVRLHSVVMANLVIGENAFPEFIHHDCTPEKLAAAMMPLFDDTPERAAQLAAIERVRAVSDPGGQAPSRRAARVVLETLQQGPGRHGSRRLLETARHHESPEGKPHLRMEIGT